jgi:Holliday junction resolvasome RuvABC endonuclease subunit
LKRNVGRTVVVSEEQCQFTVLGLDCSSSTIGWGLVGKKESGEKLLLAYGHIKPLKPTYDLIYRLDDVYDKIAELCLEFDPHEVAVEEMLYYIKGLSQASTIVTLAAFNRVAALAAYREANHEVFFHAVSKIRSVLKKEINGKESIKKEDVPDIIVSCLGPEFKFIKNRKGSIAKETGDEADGIAVALVHVLEKR